jgi:hypothetical protein
VTSPAPTEISDFFVLEDIAPLTSSFTFFAFLVFAYTHY